MTKYILWLLAFAAFAVFGDRVTKNNWDTLGPGEKVVTDVDLTGLPTDVVTRPQAEQIAADAAGAAKTEAKGYADQKKTEAIAAAKGYTDTAVAGATPGDYANVSNKAMTAVQTETDPNVPSWAKSAENPSYTKGETYNRTEVDGLVAQAGKVKKVANKSPDASGNVPLTATDVGAADVEQFQQLQAVVTTYTAFVDGSNVVFSITNYLSGSYVLNDAKFKILELKDGGYQEVYNSRTEILLHVTNETQKIVGFVNAATNALAGTISGKADKAWGKYTSAGGEAPSNTVYMTAPNTVFAGGMEYERVAVGEGAICVLTTKGAPVYTQGDEGTFKFQDDGGTNYFGFAKSDSYTQGCRTDGITVQNQMVTLHYDITMSGVPCIWYKEDLTSSEPWEQLNLPDRSAVPGATHQVQWEENPDPGTQECHINVNGEPKGFFKATVEVAGSAKFISNMPADLSGGIFCTDGLHKVGIDWNNGNPRFVEVQ